SAWPPVSLAWTCTTCAAASRPRAWSTSTPSTTSDEQHDHRLPRPLHHRTRGTRPLPRQAEGGAGRGPDVPPRQGRAQHHRRCDPREPRGRPAQAAERARHRPHPGFAARELDGAPPRQRDHQPLLDRALQRADPTHHAAVSRELRRRRPAAADARRGAEGVRRRARALRHRVRLRRLQPNPDPSGGYWTDPPLGDRYWYPLYEKLV